MDRWMHGVGVVVGGLGRDGREGCVEVRDVERHREREGKR